MQNTILSDICKIKLDAFLPKKVIEEETNTVTTSHSDEYSSEDQATFFIGEMSLFAKLSSGVKSWRFSIRDNSSTSSLDFATDKGIIWSIWNFCPLYCSP